MSTELTELEIQHIAGVDAPANSIPGFMVMKEGTEAQAAEAQLAAIYATLGGATVLQGAPEEIRKAVEQVSGYVEKQLSADEPEPSLIEKMKALFKAVPKADQGASDDAPDDQDGKTKTKKAKSKKLVAPADGDDDLAAKESRDVQKAEVKERVEKALEKQLTPVMKELTDLRKQYETDLDSLREVLAKMIERQELLENELVGSYQPVGQEGTVEKSVAAGSLEAGILSAFAGNRVSLR